MRGEIDDQQLAARHDQTRGLGHGGGGIGQVVQDLMHDHQIGAAVRQAGREDVAVAQLDLVQPGLGHIGAGDVQHVLRQVEADRHLRLLAEQGQHPARAGAQVHDPFERAGAGRLFDGGFDGALADIEGAHLVPLGRDLFEIAGGVDGALLAHLVQTAMVGLALGVVQQVQHRVDQAARQRVVRQTVEDSRPVGESFDQPCVGHQFQVARHARLALIQNPRQLHDRQLLGGQQGQHPQTGRLARGAQGFNGLVSSQCHEVV
ncbi:hypothetical protein D3C85_1237440 [compost metagenome]